MRRAAEEYDIPKSTLHDHLVGKVMVGTASPLSYARIVGSDPNIIAKYFDLLERTLVDNELIEQPSQMFNLDETGMLLDPSPLHVVVERGTKHPSAIGSGDKSQITVLVCCSAAGYALPPFVIFDGLSSQSSKQERCLVWCMVCPRRAG